MKLLPVALVALVLATVATDGSPGVRSDADDESEKMIDAEQQSPVQEQQNPVQVQQSSSLVSTNACVLTGTYKQGTDVSACSSITGDSLIVPAGVTLDLTKTERGAVIEFKGVTTFGTQM